MFGRFWLSFTGISQISGGAGGCTSAWRFVEEVLIKVNRGHIWRQSVGGKDENRSFGGRKSPPGLFFNPKV